MAFGDRVRFHPPEYESTPGGRGRPMAELLVTQLPSSVAGIVSGTAAARARS